LYNASKFYAKVIHCRQHGDERGSESFGAEFGQRRYVADEPQRK